MTLKRKPVIKKVIVNWLPRYSDTMEDDDMGRWARVAYAGRFDKAWIKQKICRWEIAWIKKVRDIKPEHAHVGKYVITPSYPFNGKYVHDSLDEAMKEVEETFVWFIKNCVSKIS